MTDQLSVTSVGEWLKQHWWQTAAGAVVIVAATMWLMAGERARIPDGGTPEERAQAIGVIVDDNKPGAAEVLTAAVHDRSPIVREAAVAGMVRLKQNPEAVRTALQDPDAGVQVAAAEGIGAYKEPWVADTLGPIALDNGANVKVRKAAVEGLMRDDSTKSVALVAQALLVPNQEVAQTAADVLSARMSIRWEARVPLAKRIEILRKTSFVRKAMYATGIGG